MYSALIEIKKKDGKIIKKFTKNALEYLSFSLSPLDDTPVYINLKKIIFSMCNMDEVEKIEAYLIYWDIKEWNCMALFLILNKAKYNLTKKIEFLKEKQNEVISEEELQKKLPNNKSFLNLISDEKI